MREFWQCGECGSAHDTQREAKECCYPEPKVMYECEECGETDGDPRVIRECEGAHKGDD